MLPGCGLWVRGASPGMFPEELGLCPRTTRTSRIEDQGAGAGLWSGVIVSGASRLSGCVSPGMGACGKCQGVAGGSPWPKWGLLMHPKQEQPPQAGPPSLSLV